VEKPDISFSRDSTDFGKGFYTTSVKSQAEKWTNRFKRRLGHGTISIYEFDEKNLRENASVLEFETYSIEWLEFIAKCRHGDMGGNYDLVIGGVANDDVYTTLGLFFRGLIEKEEAIKRLRYEKPNIQYCFRNQEVIDKYLKFKGEETL
jgi:hypothetical protein